MIYPHLQCSKRSGDPARSCRETTKSPGRDRTVGNYGGPPGVVRDGRGLWETARVMSHDVILICPEAHDFNLG